MTTEKKQLRVLVIDDHKVARDGLKMMLLSLRKYYDIIVWDAETGEEGLRKVDQHDCNLVLVDYELPGISGAETVLRLRRFKPFIWIFAISHNEELAYIESMQDAGINGYLQKGLNPPEMLEAIRTVLRGKMYFSSDISLKLIQARQPAPTPVKDDGTHFTRREKQVVELLAEGFTNEEIASKLFVCKRTVDTHRQNMLEKFAAKNVAELIRIGFRMGVLQ